MDDSKPAEQDGVVLAGLAPEERWSRWQRLGYYHAELGLWLDLSCVRLGPADVGLSDGPAAVALTRAMAAMDELEAGAVANPDEQRRVGHYWLRAPELAPEPALRNVIEDTVRAVEDLATRVHRGELRPERGDAFTHVLVIGIGGSALGPQLVADALGRPDDAMTVRFCDNTDPDGMDRLVAQLGEALQTTLCVVISKSGGTKETRNGMLELARAYEQRGLVFGRHAVAVTGDGSQLARYAEEHRFLACLPMWSWVGGRTSVTSAVGLLPAALQGVPVRELLAGAKLMDEATRQHRIEANPAALLAATWHHAGEGRGRRDLVVIPYKDRLILLSRYLQQLVMESLGKRLDLDGNRVEQGIVVYGNKGSTDQHAYVQQLLDGLDSSLVTLIEVLEDRPPGRVSMHVEPGVTTGDYLSGFLQGTRRALRERDRQSVTLTLKRVDPRTLGAVIALFERAVGLYALLVNINAYHQPAVESGKRAAADVLALQRRLCEALRLRPGQALTADELAAAVGADDCETVFWILRHLSANADRGVQASLPTGAPFWQMRFQGG